MNIRQLEYFIVMAETQQITEAAQQLYIAQPPLSRSLQRLENELGVVLFTRTKKGLELTDTGKDQLYSLYLPVIYRTRLLPPLRIYRLWYLELQRRACVEKEERHECLTENKESGGFF